MTGHLTKGSLLSRVIESGFSPINTIFKTPVFKTPVVSESNQYRCGVVDSLRHLLMHEHFLKPYSDEHVLAVLLTKAF